MLKRFIFGLGTGRCGTVSLSRLLDMQEGFAVSHEIVGGPLWEFNAGYIDLLMDRLFTYDGLVAGDVAYHLIPYVESLIERFRDSRFICLRRDREATIRSFRMKLSGRGHPWQIGIRNKQRSGWIGQFITANIPDFTEVIGRYWIEYNDCADEFQRRYPDRFRIWPMEALNTRAGQGEILSFAGVPEGKMMFDIGLRHNQSPPAYAAAGVSLVGADVRETDMPLEYPPT